MKKQKFGKLPPRLYCSFCGSEIGNGEIYWQINGSILCETCLPAYARADYCSCRQVHGEEEVL